MDGAENATDADHVSALRPSWPGPADYAIQFVIAVVVDVNSDSADHALNSSGTAPTRLANTTLNGASTPAAERDRKDVAPGCRPQVLGPSSDTASCSAPGLPPRLAGAAQPARYHPLRRRPSIPGLSLSSHPLWRSAATVLAPSPTIVPRFALRLHLLRGRFRARLPYPMGMAKFLSPMLPRYCGPAFVLRARGPP